MPHPILGPTVVRGLLVGLALVAAPHGHAQSARPALLEDRAAPSTPIAPAPGDGTPASIQTSLGRFGDPLRLRSRLDERGIAYTIAYTNEGLANLSGGMRHGPVYAGKLEGVLTADLEKLVGARGLGFFANAFQIHDTGGLRDRSFGSLITISNIEAFPSTRLSEFWLEQQWRAAHLGLRIGQLTADGEFFGAESGKLFLGNDWPTITGTNLPSGGPAYPLATPGLRLRYAPNANFTALAAIFDGDPGNQLSVNRSGTSFRLRDPPLLMTEIQHHARPGTAGLPATTLKLGGYHHFGSFGDQRFDDTGQSLGRQSSSGNPRMLGGDSGVYAIADLQLYRPRGGAADDGISTYVRLSASPADRNLIDRWADGGVVLSGLVPRRPDDHFGASVIYAHIGAAARALDRDALVFMSAAGPLRRHEATFDLSYQAQIAPGWLMQPDLQYVLRPAGGVSHPNDPTRAIRGGPVIGLRSTIVY